MTDAPGRSAGSESLASLRRRLRQAFHEGNEGILERWQEELAADSRSGARALAASCRRRLETVARERVRLGRLFERRQELRNAGLRWIAGVDEVGVGPLAGPVVAAAVILPDRIDLPGLNDSKKVPVARRKKLAAAIRRQADAWAIGEVPPDEIDRLNIFHASLEAMRRAVADLAHQPTDGPACAASN